MKKPAILISTIFGLGYFPKAPGTIGTLFAAIVYFLLPNYIFERFMNQIYLLVLIIILSCISVIFINKTEKKLGHDNGKIIIDEFFGYFISILFLPKNLFVCVGAFILFRIFDIFKPEPVNILQQLPGGWGVLADDIMAGIYANLVLQVVVRLVH